MEKEDEAEAEAEGGVFNLVLTAAFRHHGTMDQMPVSPSGLTPASESPPPASVGITDSFAPRVAIFSLVVPVVAGVLGLLSTHLRTSISATGADWPGVMIAISGLLVLAGVVASILALVLAQRPGQKGMLGLALAGLLLNFGIAMAVDLPNVSVINKAKTEKLLSLVAGNDYLQKLQQASNDYYTHMKSLRDAQVLDMKGVEQREQLEPRKTLVRQFLAANDQLRNLFANAESLYAQELVKVNLSQAATASQMMKYRQGAGANEQAMKIRDADQRIGDSLLSALNLLDESWGNWKYDAGQKRVVFSEGETEKKFLKLTGQFDAAAQELAKLQDQLVSAQRREP